jgi:hypothetical protein
MEILVELLAELLFELIGQIAIEFGWSSIAHAFHGRRKANPVLAAVGILMLGAGVGLVVSFLMPGSLLPPSRVPALSLFVAPLIAGSIMKALGDWRRAAIPPSWRRSGVAPCSRSPWPWCAG